MPDTTRYQRNLGTLGAAGQQRLEQSHVLVVGLGGLGGCVLEQLVRLGVGHITAVDPDVFEPTNLNRQLLSDLSSLGISKVEKARQRVALLHDRIVFDGIVGRHSDVPQALWKQADLVMDCLDNIPDRLDLARCCARAGATLIHGAIAGWYGQVACVEPGSDILERIYPEALQDNELVKEWGTPMPTVMVTAGLMVAQAILYLCDLHKTRAREIQYVDLQASRLWHLKMDDAPQAGANP